MTRLRWYFITAVMLCAACACSTAPDNTMTQFRSFTADGERQVSFTVELSDTCTAYTAELTARLSRKDSPEMLTVSVRWESPYGITASETISLPSDFNTLRQYLRDNPDQTRIRMASTPSCYDVSWKYRDNIRIKEAGTWVVSLNITGNRKAVLGAGIQISTE